jgi:hypothetical protein
MSIRPSKKKVNLFLSPLNLMEFLGKSKKEIFQIEKERRKERERDNF